MACKICGKSLHLVHQGFKLPLCVECERKWQDSPERVEFATARERFIERERSGLPPTTHHAAAGSLSISELQHMTGSWADRVFPDRTVHTSLSKLVLEEIPEFLLSKASDPSEYADLLILVLDVAHQKGINAERAVIEKHQKNIRRVWIRTESGYYHNNGEWTGDITNT